MSVVVEIASWVLILLGCFFTLVGALGLVRMPDVYTRMHAASVTDTAGVGLLIFGMVLQAGIGLVSLKLFFFCCCCSHSRVRSLLTPWHRPACMKESRHS